MNKFLRYLIFLVGFALQSQIHASDFFWKEEQAQNGAVKQTRDGIHFTIDKLYTTPPEQMPLDLILTSSDPDKKNSTVKMALITQDPTTGQFAVQYYAIESLPKQSFPSLLEAQEFAVLCLDPSTPLPAEQQFIAPTVAPQRKTATSNRNKNPRAWRRAHLYR